MKRLLAICARRQRSRHACRSRRRRPPPYHAVGTEPFWNLLIDEHDVTFTQPDAQPIRSRRPKVIVGFAGEIYQTPRINVNIVHGQCSDGMSDRVYPDKVQVTVDGQAVQWLRRALERQRSRSPARPARASMADERTFDGTRWHVTAIDGRATPATGDYHVEFTRTRSAVASAATASAGAMRSSAT